MEVTIGKKITIVFIIPILILTVLGFFFYRNGLQSIEYTQLVSHTGKVEDAVRNVRSDIRDMETGQRGYVITGKENYLDWYYVGLSPLQQHINKLQQLVKDNPIQKKG